MYSVASCLTWTLIIEPEWCWPITSCVLHRTESEFTITGVRERTPTLTPNGLACRATSFIQPRALWMSHPSALTPPTYRPWLPTSCKDRAHNRISSSFNRATPWPMPTHHDYFCPHPAAPGTAIPAFHVQGDE